MKKIIFKGTTRTTFVFSKYAIKTPRIYKLKMFVNGWDANLDEARFSKFLQPYVTPTIFSFLGLINIQYRITPCDNEEKIVEEWKNLINSVPESIKLCLNNCVEVKMSSLGYLNGNVVACDYG